MDEKRGPLARVNVQVAKASLSKLLARVEAGEVIVLCRRGKAVARLVAETPTPGREPGHSKSGVAVRDGFEEPFLTERWLLLERRRP